MPPATPSTDDDLAPPNLWTDRILPAAALGAIIGVWVTATTWWPRLPERVPMHFDWDGTPNRWDSKDSWWVLPIIGTLIPLLLVFLGGTVVRRAAVKPDGINVPKPEVFAALSPTARARVLRPTRVFLSVAAVAIAETFRRALDATGRAAISPDGRLESFPFWIVALGLPVGAIVLHLVTRRRLSVEAENEGIPV